MKEDDDLPLGLREATQINYGIGTPHTNEPKPIPKIVSKPTNIQTDSILPNDILQKLRGPEISEDLNKELANAQRRLVDGDKNAQADVNNILQEIARSQSKSPMSGLNPNIKNENIEEEHDIPLGIKESSDVDYGAKKEPQVESTIPTKLATEIGVGALGGAAYGKRQRKNDLVRLEEEKLRLATLPPEMRPVNTESLQRYINSQLQHPVPLDKLSQITGVDIRTMSEAQKAIKQIQGTEASREPIVRNLDGSRKTVAYKNISAQQPIDISSFAVEPPTFFNKLGSNVANVAKAVPSTAMKYMSPIVGGAVAAPQLIESGTNFLQNKPVDTTQVMSGLGGLGMMARSPLLSIPGLLAQLPYLYKHKNEIANGLSMSEINPTAFGFGTPEGMETVGSMMQKP